MYKSSYENEEQTEQNSEIPIMYILVNADLVKNMSKGEVAAHCCHAVCEVIWFAESNYSSNAIYKDWKKNSQAKLVKKAPESLLIQSVSNYHGSSVRSTTAVDDPIWCAPARDTGLTQLDSNSLKAVAFFPMDINVIPFWLEELILL